jgi:hypothetical protein
MSEPEQPPTDVGAGLPEDGQPGTGIDPREHAENEVPCDDAPDTSPPEDSDPGTATGNPRAAGGDDSSTGAGA